MAKTIQGILRIGVVGYSPPTKFDENTAKQIIHAAFERIAQEFPTSNKIVVSGYTDTGISYFAYREAKRRGWRTAGIACSKAKEYPLYPCDESIIIGNEWGDESSTFLQNIDILVRIGGGNQSHREAALFKEILNRRCNQVMIQEFNLEKQ